MAKVTLEFDPFEDREAMEDAINGWKWKMVVWDLDEKLRGYVKYSEDSISGNKIDAYDHVRNLIREITYEYNISLD